MEADADASSPRPCTSLARASSCMLLASGAIASLIVYGLLQERIMTVSYGGVLFQDSVFLVLMNRVAAVTFALVMACARGEKLGSQAPLWKYAVVALANVGASTCQYEALKYVTFTAQMLGKSFKMMPVMVWGILLSRKRYGFQDWITATAITGGATIFLLAGPIEAATGDPLHQEGRNCTRGLLLLLLFLAFDGVTSTMQEKLFRENRTTKYNQMIYINGISALFSGLALHSSGTLLPVVAFSLRNSDFLRDALCLSCSAVAGQWFIYTEVKEFGALVFAATMNVRQITSILLSYLIYRHSITELQVLGLICIFVALLSKSCSGLLQQPSILSEKQHLLKGGRSQETTLALASGKLEEQTSRVEGP